MSPINTHQKGLVRSIIFHEKGEWFGVALEFNIVETGDSPQEVMLLLDNAIRGYIESAKKAKLSVGVLNQKPDPEYESLWKFGEDSQKNKGKKIYSFSSSPLTMFAM